MSMKSIALALTVLASSQVFAAQGDWLVRGRLIDIAPSVSTSGALSTLGIGVDKQVVPELDFTYMMAPNWGAELILGTARHKVTSFGDSLGKVSHLPPTLTFQYHFSPDAQVRPYAGVGVNYTRFYNPSLQAGPAKLDVDRNSFGGSLQLGTDIAVNKSWFVNFDLKKIYIKTDVKTTTGANLGTLRVNPLVFGIGIGTKF
jgi:outer membrane protein